MQRTSGYYGDNEEMLAKLAAGASSYDMVVPTAYAMDIPDQAGQDPAARQGEDPQFQEPQSGLPQAQRRIRSGQQGRRPLLSSITAIGYNEQKIKELGIPTDSWAAIFDPQILAQAEGQGHGDGRPARAGSCTPDGQWYGPGLQRPPRQPTSRPPPTSSSQALLGRVQQPELHQDGRRQHLAGLPRLLPGHARRGRQAAVHHRLQPARKAASSASTAW